MPRYVLHHPRVQITSHPHSAVNAGYLNLQNRKCRCIDSGQVDIWLTIVKENLQRAKLGECHEAKDIVGAAEVFPVNDVERSFNDKVGIILTASWIELFKTIRECVCAPCSFWASPKVAHGFRTPEWVHTSTSE